MSLSREEQLELVRRGLDAFSRGDLDASLAEIHPEIEWHIAFRLPDLPFDKEVYRGRDEVRQLWTAFRSAWDELTIDLEEVVAAVPGTVVLGARFRGRGQGSGAEVDQRVFFVYEIEDDQLRSSRPFETRAEALAAAGLDDAG